MFIDPNLHFWEHHYSWSCNSENHFVTSFWNFLSLLEVLHWQLTAITKRRCTNSCLLRAHVKCCNQVFQEKPNQSEVESSNAPWAIDQDYNIGNSWSFTEKFHLCKVQTRNAFVLSLEL